jgi:hypothetical protein
MSPQSPDPILAAIRRHRLADAASSAAADDDEVLNPLLEAENKAFWGLVETRPITTRGIWALCDYLAEFTTREEFICDRQDYDDDRAWRFIPRLLTNIRDAIEGANTSPSHH